MNVLAVCADPGIVLDGVKGATVHVVELWRALAGEGCRVRGVAGVRGPGVVDVAPGVTVVAVPAPRGAEPGTFPARVLAAARADLARPGVVRPDWVLERLALDSVVGTTLAGELGVPLVVEVNAPLDDEARRYRDANVGGESSARLRATLAEASLVVCVSAALVPWVVSRGGSPQRIRVLPNGVRVAAFSGPRDEPASGGPVRVGFVGSFKRWHGLDLLLEAWHLARSSGADLTLELLGDGPERATLEARVRDLGAGDRVHFLGSRPHHQVGPFLRGIDIAVAAAPADGDAYFSPLKVYEYAAAGCAIVAPSTGQTGERFAHECDALLVPPGDAVALCAALIRLAAQPDLRRRLGQAARQRAGSEFDWSHVAGRLLAWAGEIPRADRSMT